jgi:hypothetical protein
MAHDERLSALLRLQADIQRVQGNQALIDRHVATLKAHPWRLIYAFKLLRDIRSLLDENTGLLQRDVDDFARLNQGDLS